MESWISQASAVTLESTGDHLVLIFVVHVEAEDVSGQSIVHSIEAPVARIHVAFDQVCEHAQALGSVDVDLLTVLVIDMTEIDGVHDAHL